MPFLAEISGDATFFDQLFYAIALHDIGKSATGFQRQLTSKKRWKYRHEILSAGFVNALQLPKSVKQSIGLAILTHHKDIEILREKFPTYPESNPGYGQWIEKVAELEPNWNLIREFQNQICGLLPIEDHKFEPISSIEKIVNAADFSRYA